MAQQLTRHELERGLCRWKGERVVVIDAAELHAQVGVGGASVLIRPA